MKNETNNVPISTNKCALYMFLLFVGFLIYPVSVWAAPINGEINQTNNNKNITLQVKDKTLIYILSEIKKQTGLAYGFKDSRSATDKRLYSIDVKDMRVDAVLAMLLKDSKYIYTIEDGLIYITEKKVTQLANAEEKTITVKGRVVDEKGNPIVGANIIIHGTSMGIASDANGRYELQVKPDAVLRFTFIGYKEEIIAVKGKSIINARLNRTEENLEEVTVVAFGEQKKESVVSSITTVDPSMLKSSSSDLTTQFAGKIAGMIGWQTGGIPGALTEEEMNTKFYVRGITSFQSSANIDPLILLDGVESSKLDLARIAPEDIETFSVMKDASATAMYGARGANGVILVTTKKGEEGSVYTSVRYEAVASMPTRKIDVVDPITYMRMYNSALTTRNSSATPHYSAERISRTGSPDYPDFIYPANDWYKIMFKEYSINHRLGINIRGGSRVMQYYASVNYNRDEGMLKTEKLNQFDCNIKNDTYTYRANMNIDLSAGIKLVLNSTASLDKYHGPYSDVRQAYGMAFSASPTDFAAIYPADEAYAWPHLRFGNDMTGDKTNPYMELHRGYSERKRYSATSRLEYIQNLSALIKGLELRASFSLNKVGYYAIAYNTRPYMYYCSPDNYDFETGKHTLIAVNPLSAKRTLSVDNEKGANTQSTQLSYEVRGLHTAAWKEHQTSLTAVLTAQELTTSNIATVLDGIPQRNMSFSMRGSYGYKDRYFVEGSFGYNGSERFEKDHQWGFFPALGCAWVASKEPIISNSMSQWLSLLKFRFSWGKVGNDGIITSPRFTHLPILGSETVTDPRPDEQNSGRYVISSYPNGNIKWEIAEQMNLGIETKFWDGIVEANVDIYQEIRHNILDYRITVPATVGLETYQLANVGRARSRGIDISGKIQHAFTNDFWIILNGTFTYSKAVFQRIEEATDKPAWQLKKGNELSQAVGYIAEGLFRDQAEIDNSPVQGGDVMPGDIRYRDLNGDGVIDVSDATHIGFPETPRMIYGFSGFFNLKNLELNFSFQGSGKRSFFMDPMSINPFYGDKAMLKAIYKDHWSESNMSTHPFWPRLSTQAINVHNPQEDWNSGAEIRKSTYFMRECSFLRCTSIELGYNLPKKALKAMKMQTVKVYARVNNPFLISSFDVWDVELGSNGFNYPIQRTYSAGVNISF